MGVLDYFFGGGCEFYHKSVQVLRCAGRGLYTINGH